MKKAGKKGAVKVSKSAHRVRQNETENRAFSEQKERAAFLVAEDRLSDELIADAVDVGRATLARWKLETDFVARVEEVRAELRAKVLAQGIAAKQNRLDALNDRHERMRAVIDARAKEHAGYQGGGATGLLVRQIKVIGKGDDAREVEEYTVDTALLREMREHEKQVAIEVGQWAEKHEHTGKDGGPIETSDASLTDDQRAGRIAAILDAARARRDGQPSGR